MSAATKKKYGRAAANGSIPSAFAAMAKADKIGTEKFTAKKSYGGDVGLGLNSDAVEMHRKKLAEKNESGHSKSSLNSRGSARNARPKLNILSLVDDALEDGPTSEAKERAAAEKAAVVAPILPKRKVVVRKAKKSEEKPTLAPQVEPTPAPQVEPTPAPQVEPPPEKPEEKIEVVDTSPKKPEVEAPKPRSALLLSKVDKAIELDPPEAVPSLFGSAVSKTTTSNGSTPAWKTRLQEQKVTLGQTPESPTTIPTKQASFKSPIKKMKKAESTPKKTKSTPVVAAKPKSSVKLVPKQESPKTIVSPKPSPTSSPPPAPAPKSTVSPAPVKSPDPKAPSPVIKKDLSSSVPAATSKKDTKELSKKTTKEVSKPTVYISDGSNDSDDDVPKKATKKTASPKKSPSKGKSPSQKKSPTKGKSPATTNGNIESDYEHSLPTPTVTTIAVPTLDPRLLVPSGDARLDRLRKELEESKKKLESIAVNTKIELADLKKEIAMEKETLRVKFLKDIQAHKKVNEKVDKEHQKAFEREHGQVEELKAANARLRATMEKLPMQIAEVTVSSESLSRANEDISAHFDELNKFAKKLQADQDKLQESSRKCKDEYLPRYRQELWERQQHLNAETKIKNLYRECMIKIHNRVDKTNQMDLIEDIATMVLETEGEVNPKFDPKFLSESAKKNSSDSDSENDSDSSSSGSDSDSD